MVKDELRGRTRVGDDDIEYSVRARDIEELHRLQTSSTTNLEGVRIPCATPCLNIHTDDVLQAQLQSISESLRHTERKCVVLRAHTDAHTDAHTIQGRTQGHQAPGLYRNGATHNTVVMPHAHTYAAYTCASRVLLGTTAWSPWRASL